MRRVCEKHIRRLYSSERADFSPIRQWDKTRVEEQSIDVYGISYENFSPTSEHSADMQAFF